MAEPSYFVTSSGALTEVKPEDVQGAVQMGWTVASPKQVEDHLAEQKYGTTGQQALTGVEAAGRALSLGTSTILERAAGVPKEDIAGREAVNPVSAGVGTAVGIAAPLILSGGAAAAEEAGALGAAKTAARFSAPSLISGAGRAVGSAVERALPEATSTLGRIGSKALEMGVGGATEGAIYGVGQVVHEAALGDPNLTAQSAISEIGLSAAMGGGLGGLLGASEVAIPAAVKTAREAVSATLSKARGGFEELYPQVAEKLTGVNRETVSKLLADRELIIRDPVAKAKLMTDFGESLQSQYSAVEDALHVANRDMRPGEIESLTHPVPAATAHAEVSGAYDRFSQTIDEMRAKPELFPPRFAAKLEEIRHGLTRDGLGGEGFAGDALKTDPTKAFRAINDAKDELRKLSQFGKLSPAGDEDAANAVKALRHDLRTSLEDENVWGAAGARQSAFNEAQSEYFTARTAFQKELMKKSVGRGGAIEFRVAPTKLGTFANQMADSRGGVGDLGRGRVLDEFVSAQNKLLDQIEASHQAMPATDFDRAALKRLVDKTADITAQAKKQASVTQLMNQLDPKMSWGANPVAGAAGPVGIGGMASTVGGYLVGGPVGAAAGALHAAYKFATNVPRAVATLTALERMATRASNAIDFGVSAALRGSLRGAASSVRGETAEELEALFAKRVAQIHRLGASPEQMHATLEKQAEHIQEHAPQTAQALSIATSTAIGFLSSKIPKHPKTAVGAPAWKHPRTELERFDRYHRAIEKPVSILADAANGTLTPEGVEAVSTVYPALMGKIRESVLSRVSASQDPLPHRQAFMLSMLTGTDLDGTMNPGAILANQAAIRGPSSKSPEDQTAIRPTSKGASAITLSSRLRTPMQSSTERGNA